MTNYQQLANELKDTLAKYRPATQPKTQKSYRSEYNQKYYLKWKKKNPPRTEAGKRWGKVGINRILKNLSDMLNISTDAARARYYRNQVPKQIIELAKAKLN